MKAVTVTGSRKRPFALAAGLLVLAGTVIWRYWDENYGGTKTTNDKGKGKPKPAVFVLKRTPLRHHLLPLHRRFIAATLASSLAFYTITERRLMQHAALLVAILVLSAACFFLSAAPTLEQAAFWVFCPFEAAVGMYWPCMGYLKGRLVDDAVCAQVYGILRIPLNIFVVVSLLLTGDGNSFGTVFSACSSLLPVSAGALWALMANHAQ
ncbi:uncharacterized protein C8A04DRAFT_24833 [Dichotomopilus funicola]|uniref:Uncharacterized protein n=1 Tax=Dichotomopilus funicola TaxID=1934379 RepID=A0AAN6VAN2_9PEZI|nr:hypothetical protein C8A04DRAFT_24833 [Dichotomopilus funicola]